MRQGRSGLKQQDIKDKRQHPWPGTNWDLQDKSADMQVCHWNYSYLLCILATWLDWIVTESHATACTSHSVLHENCCLPMPIWRVSRSMALSPHQCCSGQVLRLICTVW